MTTFLIFSCPWGSNKLVLVLVTSPDFRESSSALPLDLSKTKAEFVLCLSRFQTHQRIRIFAGLFFRKNGRGFPRRKILNRFELISRQHDQVMTFNLRCVLDSASRLTRASHERKQFRFAVCSGCLSVRKRTRERRTTTHHSAKSLNTRNI